MRCAGQKGLLDTDEHRLSGY